MIYDYPSNNWDRFYSFQSSIRGTVMKQLA